MAVCVLLCLHNNGRRRIIMSLPVFVDCGVGDETTLSCRLAGMRYKYVNYRVSKTNLYTL